jgi:hypothetical protein
LIRRHGYSEELGWALVKASERNMIIEILRLLSQGADVNCMARWMHEGEEKSTTPLIAAALKGHADTLMSRGAEVNKTKPTNGFTALRVAVQEVHVCL